MSKYQVIILAAGKGTRLKPITRRIPKTLVKVKNKPLIKIILNSLNKKFTTEILIIVGYKYDKIKKLVGEKFKGIPVKYLFNPLFYKTNSTYSMWLASPLIQNNVIIINADTIFDKKILQFLIKSKYPNALSVDDNIKTPLPAEAMKVTLMKNKIIDVSKKIKKDKTHGDAIGIYKFDNLGVKNLKKNLDSLIYKNNIKNLFTLAVKNMLKKLDIHYVSTMKKKWIEIDNIQDLKDAKKMFK